MVRRVTSLSDVAETCMERSAEHIPPKAFNGQREIRSVIDVSAVLGGIPRRDGRNLRASALHNPFTREARPRVRLVMPHIIPNYGAGGELSQRYDPWEPLGHLWLTLRFEGRVAA
jgi:hypothetical protein